MLRTLLLSQQLCWFYAPQSAACETCHSKRSSLVLRDMYFLDFYFPHVSSVLTLPCDVTHCSIFRSKRMQALVNALYAYMLRAKACWLCVYACYWQGSCWIISFGSKQGVLVNCRPHFLPLELTLSSILSCPLFSFCFVATFHCISLLLSFIEYLLHLLCDSCPLGLLLLQLCQLCWLPCLLDCLLLCSMLCRFEMSNFLARNYLKTRLADHSWTTSRAKLLQKSLLCGSTKVFLI